MDPSVVIRASLGIIDGSSIEKVISRMSFTSGKDKNDESHIASTINPKGPYGNNVAFSQAEIESKNDIKWFQRSDLWGYTWAQAARPNNTLYHVDNSSGLQFCPSSQFCFTYTANLQNRIDAAKRNP